MYFNVRRRLSLGIDVPHCTLMVNTYMKCTNMGVDFIYASLNFLLSTLQIELINPTYNFKKRVTNKENRTILLI